MGVVSLSCYSPVILRSILRRPAAYSNLHVSSIPHSFLKHTSPFASISILSPPLPISLTTTLLIPRSLSTTTTQTDVLSETDDSPIETQTEILDARVSNTHKELLSKLQTMSVKEKKELGSYANSLGKKLKSQQVGKSGVTDSVATALLETLEANELLKLKIHNNCPGELDDVVSRLEEATGSVVVARIGRTVIIYRPSLTKLKAEEKKKQAMKVFLKRRVAFKSSYQGRTQSRGQSAPPSSRSRAYRRS